MNEIKGNARVLACSDYTKDSRRIVGIAVSGQAKASTKVADRFRLMYSLFRSSSVVSSRIFNKIVRFFTYQEN